MRVLVGCEFSGAVRRAFRALGHDAWSCDVLPTEDGGEHIQGDVLAVIGDGWDLGIFHPPCTYLANSGAKHLYIGTRKEHGINEERWQAMVDASAFFRRLLDAPIPRVAVENPIIHGHAVARIGRKPSQVVQPWQFGHGETKATCLWLRGLPKLTPTQIVSGREQRVHRMAPGPTRQKERSRTYAGIAEAMAAQWGTVDELRLVA